MRGLYQVHQQCNRHSKYIMSFGRLHLVGQLVKAEIPPDRQINNIMSDASGSLGKRLLYP